MIRGWLLAMGAIGLALAALFAAYPQIDIEAARWFFDHETEKFSFAHSDPWLRIRQALNWIPYLFLAPAVFVLLRKICFPGSRMLMAPSVVFFLIGTIIAGPALTSNLVLKENWGRPRPNHVTQFAGDYQFQPWWRPGGDCPRNCSFVSGEASQAYWLIAPATLAAPQVRVVAMGAAVAFGTVVGTLRMVFGRHFLSDVAFAAVITISIVMGFYWLLLNPIRRNDARLEKAIGSVLKNLHRSIGKMLIGAGTTLNHAGRTLRRSGRPLQNLPPLAQNKIEAVTE